jgi:hypothetical protein
MSATGLDVFDKSPAARDACAEPGLPRAFALLLFGSTVAAIIAGSALAQNTAPSAPAASLAVKPVPSQEQTPDSDAIRTKIEKAGYAAITDLSRDNVGIWRARGKRGNDAVDIAVDKGGRIKAVPR